MKFLIFSLMLAGIAGVATWLRSKADRVSLDEAFDRNKKAVCEGVKVVLDETLHQDLNANLATIPGFLGKVELLCRRSSQIPLETLNGFWRIGLNRYWTFSVRVICSAKDAALLAGVLEQTVRETLEEEGHQGVITYVRITTDSKIPDQRFIHCLLYTSPSPRDRG